MAITLSNLYSEGFTLLRNSINANIVDPKRGNASSNRRWIYREFPDTTSRTFDGYPIITILSPELDDETQDLQGGLSNAEMQYAVQVFVEFNDKDARVDSISNAIYAHLNSLATKRTLLSQNLDIEKINSSGFNNEEIDGKKLSVREFTITASSTIHTNGV